MIRLHIRQGNTTRVVEVVDGSEFTSDVTWVDMIAPTSEELALAERCLKIDIPTKNEVWKNHVLNRLYMEEGTAFLTAALISKTESPYPRTSAVTFILAPKFLLTVHEIHPTSFSNFAARLQKSNYQIQTSADLFEGLLEEIITRVAFNSEIVVDALDDLSHSIFASNVLDKRRKNTTQSMKSALKKLGDAADLNSKINESLHSLSRMLVFFKQVILPKGGPRDSSIDTLITDVSVLTTQTSFLSDKITFQLDATLGMINVEQNLIIKIFSIVTVFFLPPTLVSSIYGMNFHHMPELDWIWGYPIALGIMVVCAIVPHIYFKKKGWL